MLVEEGGTEIVSITRYVNEASRLGNSELVRILLKVAEMKNLDVDVGMALVVAAQSGCMPVVEWFVKRGCTFGRICSALAGAISGSQVDVAAFLLHHVPHNFLANASILILNTAGTMGVVNSFDGVAYLLHSDVLGDPPATYAAADTIALSDDDNEDVAPDLRAFIQEHWSNAAFFHGMRQGQENYMNVVRILKRGESPICLDLLPPALRVAIAYLPLYRECVKSGGYLVSQRLRGQLVEAVRRLGGGVLDGVSQCRELLAVWCH